MQFIPDQSKVMIEAKFGIECASTETVLGVEMLIN
jgi:hypothetical protein